MHIDSKFQDERSPGNLAQSPFHNFRDPPLPPRVRIALWFYIWVRLRPAHNCQIFILVAAANPAASSRVAPPRRPALVPARALGAADASTSGYIASKPILDVSGFAARPPVASTNANRLRIFSGTSNTQLSREVVQYLGMDLGHIKIKKFADGEVYVQLQESVRGCDVFLIQVCATGVIPHPSPVCP